MNTTKKRQVVQKKIKVKQRHKAVAEAFEIWIKKNPEAGMERRISTFDAYCDSAILNEAMKKCRMSKT